MITPSQQHMTVTGRPSVINALTELAVSDFDLANSFALDKAYQLNVELPDGVESVDNITTVTLTFNTEGLATKTVNVSNLRLINQPANVQIKLNTNRLNNVVLVGPKGRAGKAERIGGFGRDRRGQRADHRGHRERGGRDPGAVLVVHFCGGQLLGRVLHPGQRGGRLMLLVRGIRLPLTACAPEQEATARALQALRLDPRRGGGHRRGKIVGGRPARQAGAGVYHRHHTQGRGCGTGIGRGRALR